MCWRCHAGTGDNLLLQGLWPGRGPSGLVLFITSGLRAACGKRGRARWALFTLAV